MTVFDIKNKQGYAPTNMFSDCWYGVKYAEDLSDGYNVAIIDREGDIIRMRLQKDHKIKDDWRSFAKLYRLPDKGPQIL